MTVEDVFTGDAGASPHTLVGAHAVSALGARERERFEQHLASCPDCRLEVRELQAAAARLASLVATPPPPQLRARVLARAAAEAQLPPEAAVRPATAPPGPPATRAPGAPAGPAAPAPALTGGPRTPAAPWWRSPLGLAAAVLLVAALTGLAGLGGLAYRQSQRIDELSAAGQRVEQVINSAERVTRAGSATGGGTGTVVAAEGAAVFLADGLPALPPNRAYQLWVIRGQDPPRSVAVLPPADALTQLVTDVRAGDAVAVSVEPAAGSPAPTTTPLLVINV